MVGKKLGTDIVDNKKTFLMIKTLEKASPTQKKELTSWLTKKEFNREEKIESVTSIFDSLNIKKITEERIKDFYDLALANLKNLNRPEERKVELYNFASFLMNRNK